MTVTVVACRHGRSLANEANVVAADLERCRLRYGLSEGGKDDAIAALRQQSLTFRIPTAHIRIVSSPFLRAKETAAIFQSAFGLEHVEIEVDDRVRERYFGKANENSATATDVYRRVWAADYLDDDNHREGVESPRQVCDRLLSFLSDLQSSAGDNDVTVAVVSHGDTLLFLQCLLQARQLNEKLTLQYLNNAEVRLLGELSAPSDTDNSIM